MHGNYVKLYECYEEHDNNPRHKGLEPPDSCIDLSAVSILIVVIMTRDRAGNQDTQRALH